MFVAGTSTHKVGEVAQTLLGVAPSASAISRLNRDLEQQFTAWRERRLQEHWRILYLDGIQFSVRHGDKADSTMILTALGVDMAGNKEVLALRACAEEDKDGWVSVLQDLRTCGATQIALIVTDGHDGLVAAVREFFPATPRQRCLLHKQRNVLSAVPRRVRQEIETELLGIWAQPTKEGAVTQLAASTRQVRQALSRGRQEPGRGGGQDIDLLRLSADDASLYQDYKRYRESGKSTCVSVPTRLTCSPPTALHHCLSWFSALLLCLLALHPATRIGMASGVMAPLAGKGSFLVKLPGMRLRDMCGLLCKKQNRSYRCCHFSP
jgi:hypothetical protein